MLYPSIQDLTNDSVNRYMLVIATAKSARYLTYKRNQEQYPEYVSDMEDYDEDEKAVSVAVNKINDGQFKIVKE